MKIKLYLSLLLLLVTLFVISACGGGDDPEAACVQRVGITSGCVDSTEASCDLINGDFYEDMTCSDLGYSSN